MKTTATTTTTTTMTSAFDNVANTAENGWYCCCMHYFILFSALTFTFGDNRKKMHRERNDRTLLGFVLHFVYGPHQNANVHVLYECFCVCVGLFSFLFASIFFATSILIFLAADFLVSFSCFVSFKLSDWSNYRYRWHDRFFYLRPENSKMHTHSHTHTHAHIH